MSPIDKYNKFVIKEIEHDCLDFLKLYIQVFITLKMTYNNILATSIDNYKYSDSDMCIVLKTELAVTENKLNRMKQYINNIYLHSCYIGNTKVLKYLTENKIVRESIPREIILNGICTCMNVKNIVHFSNFIYLLDIFDIEINEINGKKYNLMKYCIMADNVDAMILLVSKYKIKLNELDKFQKDILISTALHNTARRAVDYLFGNGVITTEYLNDFPDELITNKIFQEELNNKYKYKKVPFRTVGHRYIPPQMRKKRKTTYEIFDGHQNRADKDFDWRRKEIEPVK